MCGCWVHPWVRGTASDHTPREKRNFPVPVTYCSHQLPIVPQPGVGALGSPYSILARIFNWIHFMQAICRKPHRIWIHLHNSHALPIGQQLTPTPYLLALPFLQAPLPLFPDSGEADCRRHPIQSWVVPFWRFCRILQSTHPVLALFSVGRLVITISILLLVRDLFNIFISYWFNFGMLSASIFFHFL